MELIRFQNVQRDYGHREVLSDVSFRINAGDKIGLIGPNGAGKTSIVRILIGQEHAGGGAITRAPALRVGYVPQHVDHDDNETVLDSVLGGNALALASFRAREDELARAPSAEIAAAIDAYEIAREAYEAAGGDAMRARAIGMLDALGLSDRGGQLVGSLSGGEKNVLSLTQALLAEPDLLVLDEPGNHLDFAGITWLEGFLSKFRGAVLIVSHNRYLLDRVTRTILDLEDGAVRTYGGNYSAYRQTLLREKLNQQADYVVNQKRLAQLEELVKRFEEFARRTPGASDCVPASRSSRGNRSRRSRSQRPRHRRYA